MGRRFPVAPMLTDDEVVALSVRAQAPWRTPLPTVDLADQDRVLASLMRGSRSLYVRGLLDADSDELDDELAEQIRITVLHETAHYFGAGEQDMHRFGLN